MAYSYSSLYGLPTTGLRFFTVYGPWGRPDMALFLFIKNILAGLPIDAFSTRAIISEISPMSMTSSKAWSRRWIMWLRRIRNGDRVTLIPAIRSDAPFRIYNIGNQTPVALTRYIEVLERCLGKKARKNLLPMQLGDLPDTWADVEALAREVGYRPSTDLEQGVKHFVEWYLGYYHPQSS